jgi:hypothetical protein
VRTPRRLRDVASLSVTARAHQAGADAVQIDQDIVKIDAALLEITTCFSIDLSKLEGPAGNAGPIR